MVPLNAVATQALFPESHPLPTGRIVTRWQTRSGVYQVFQRACKLAGVEGLHVHDLKRTFGTWLEECGVEYEIRQMLLGHRMPGTTERYSHGGQAFDAKLQEAVARLAEKYPLSKNLSKSLSKDVTREGDRPITH